MGVQNRRRLLPRDMRGVTLGGYVGRKGTGRFSGQDIDQRPCAGEPLRVLDAKRRGAIILPDDVRDIICTDGDFGRAAIGGKDRRNVGPGLPPIRRARQMQLLRNTLAPHDGQGIIGRDGNIGRGGVA